MGDIDNNIGFEADQDERENREVEVVVPENDQNLIELCEDPELIIFDEDCNESLPRRVNSPSILTRHFATG